MTSIRSAIERWSAAFECADLFYGHGTDNAWDEAVALVLAISGAEDRQELLDQHLEPAQLAKIDQLGTRRIEERIPLAYLLGEWPYLGLSFFVDPGVLIPRSPLGYWLREHGDEWLTTPVGRILDIGTGSGCLGIAAALAYPEAQVWLTDIDARALGLARRNVARHGLGQRCHLLAASGTESLAPGSAFDLVLCNPPYVNARDMASLPAEYRAEPVGALAAGADGLAVMLPILDSLPSVLSATGLFLGEIGHSAPALKQARPELPLIWLEDDGADASLFAVTASDLAPP